LIVNELFLSRKFIYFAILIPRVKV